MRKRFVVDANIFFSALLKPSGNNFRILVTFTEFLVTPSFVIKELYKYDTLFYKKGVDWKKFINGLVVGGLTLYSDVHIDDIYDELEDYMSSIDPKDIRYVALAKFLDIPLWTLDKKLLEEVDIVKVVDTSSVLSSF